MNYAHAKSVFENYLSQYDQTNDKIYLKTVHTFGVVKQAEDVARRMSFSPEDTELARLIALLHDIGRFEQLKCFDSFEPSTMDHAAYGVELLFEKGMVRSFISEDTYDSIIRTAIAKHSDFALENITDRRTLLHARLIRDADKLDNCRVKLFDAVETLTDVSAKELGSQEITPVIYDTVFQNRCILSSDRVTKMDYWVSYIAYFFDINFSASFDIIAENDYLRRIINRIPYSNPKTEKDMAEIAVYMENFIQAHTSAGTVNFKTI